MKFSPVYSTKRTDRVYAAVLIVYRSLFFLTDKSKPGATQGRKATGPVVGLAGLPKEG